MILDISPTDLVWMAALALVAALVLTFLFLAAASWIASLAGVRCPHCGGRVVWFSWGWRREDARLPSNRPWGLHSVRCFPCKRRMRIGRRDGRWIEFGPPT